MKRISILVLALAFALGGIGVAKADGIDVKVAGQWDFAFGWATQTSGSGNTPGWADSIHGQRTGRNGDNFVARSRVRTQINFIASEYLQGVLMFEIGNLDWGHNGNAVTNGATGRGSGAGIDADGVNVETKRAYLDWLIPNTPVSVRMGIQGVKLPSGPMGSPIMDSEAAGIVVSSPLTDMVGITAFWLRPFNYYLNDAADNSYDDEVDVFGLILPVKGDGWGVTPWFVYGFVGAESGIYDYLYGRRGSQTVSVYDRAVDGYASDDGDHAGAWWAGFNFELTMFDPLKFTFDAMYGDLHKNEIGGFAGIAPQDYMIGSRGWFLDATLDYKMDWGTPGIFGWWSSGDGENAEDDGQLGRIPVMSTDTGWQATSFGALGSPNIGSEGITIGSATGTWGIGVQIANMSFIQDLKHTIRVAYYQGTNSSELFGEDGFGGIGNTRGLGLGTYNCGDLYLTDKDHAIEVNFDHTYKIYENLTAMLELGYIHLSLDEDVWETNGRGNFNRDNDANSNAWKAQLQFQYKF